MRTGPWWRVGVVGMGVALLAAACGSADAEPSAQAPDAPDLPVIAGVVGAQDVTGAIVLGDAPPAVGRVTDDGAIAVTVHATDGATEVRWHATVDGSTLVTVTVPGELELAAIDVSGAHAALVTRGGDRADGAIAADRDNTEIVIVARDGEVFRRSYSGNLVPEGFANWTLPGTTTPGLAYVLEFTPAQRSTHYRVRTLDLSGGELGLPLNLRDKTQTIDQLMAGVSRTHLLAARDGLLFTLYRGHHDEGHGSYAFIHTLGLGNGVWCLVVPDEMELADRAGALALDPTDRRLVAVSANGTIAAIELVSITDASRPPVFDAPADLGASTDDAPAIATAEDRLWVGLGQTLLTVDPVTLEVTASATMPVAIEALGVLPTGDVVAAGSGRMFLVSGDDLSVRQQSTVPDGLGALQRILTDPRNE